MSITDNLKNIQDRINAAAERAGRNPSEIRLVTVSKTYPLPRIIEAMNAGTLTFGESKVQEAKEKIEELQGQRGKGAEAQSNVEWHLIGNLQKNKAKHAVQLFDLIHTVDTISLAEELNRQAEKIQKVQRILIQVKLSDEETKSGVQEENLVPMLKAVSAMKNLKIEGLMTMPPFYDDPEHARPYFGHLKFMADNAAAMGFPMKELSMGMSGDFEQAIEEGATLVRVGTAIFGERDYL